MRSPLHGDGDIKMSTFDENAPSNPRYSLLTLHGNICSLFCFRSRGSKWYDNNTLLDTQIVGHYDRLNSGNVEQNGHVGKVSKL